VGKIVRKRFENLQKRTKSIGDVRGLGAMLAFEMVKPDDPTQPDTELAGKLIQACYKRGVILISAGTYKNCIRVLSPLVIDEDVLNRGLDIIEEELLKLAAVPEVA
jgi:4-aminobutyrate aminotransferase / (S)-3-amino-2-methylpropionate transaminase / 5-aminovalerate transaminase